MVRYLALAALGLWVGGLLALLWLGGGGPADTRRLHQVAYACGGAVLASLFVLKFVGPPPRAFTVRAGLVVLMLAVVYVADVMQWAATVPAATAVALGLVLMSWYAHE